MIKKYLDFVNESVQDEDRLKRLREADLPEIPENYWGAEAELETDGEIIAEVWVDLFPDAPQIVDFVDGEFVFDDGNSQDPITVYANVHSYVSEEDFDM